MALQYPPDASGSAYANVLLIDSRVRSYETFVTSANADTFPIVYTPDASGAELLGILSRFSTIARIGVVFEVTSATTFMDGQPFFTVSGEQSPNVALMVNILKTFAVKNIDFLACNTLQLPAWASYYAGLTADTGVIVGASDNPTGNIKYGGDWTMENTAQDVELIYFTKAIEYYQYLLASVFAVTGGDINIDYVVDASGILRFFNKDNAGQKVFTLTMNLPKKGQFLVVGGGNDGLPASTNPGNGGAGGGTNINQSAFVSGTTYNITVGGRNNASQLIAYSQYNAAAGGLLNGGAGGDQGANGGDGTQWTVDGFWYGGGGGGGGDGNGNGFGGNGGLGGGGGGGGVGDGEGGGWLEGSTYNDYHGGFHQEAGTGIGAGDGGSFGSGGGGAGSLGSGGGGGYKIPPPGIGVGGGGGGGAGTVAIFFSAPTTTTLDITTPQTYTGSAINIFTNSGQFSGDTITITYTLNGGSNLSYTQTGNTPAGANAPTSAGSYSIVSIIGNAFYSPSVSSFIIVKAVALTLQNINRPVSPTTNGFVISYDTAGKQRYTVLQIGTED